MRCRLRILLLVFLAVAAASCRDSRLIPRRTMTEIYMDMALADGYLLSSNVVDRITADTSRVYETVFLKYGYTTEDYLYSQQEYIKDPTRYVRMVKSAVLKVEEEGARLKKLKEAQDKQRDMKEYLKRYAPANIFLLDTLRAGDTVFFNFDFQKGLDTAYYGPKMVVWADTVKAVEVKTDSVVHTVKSLNTESINKIDSIRERMRNSRNRNKETNVPSVNPLIREAQK